MSFTITITADTKEIERLIVNLDNATDEVIRTLAEEFVGHAFLYAPFEFGALRTSIHAINMGNAYQRIQPEVDYAIYQELGTYKMAAHPFLTPAIEQMSGEFLSPETWQPLFT